VRLSASGKTCCIGLGPSVPSLLAIDRRHSDADRVAPLPRSFAPAGIAPPPPAQDKCLTDRY
jgi:hypothetical protein